MKILKVVARVGAYCFVAFLGYMAAVILGLYASKKDWSNSGSKGTSSSGTCHAACPCSVDLGA